MIIIVGLILFSLFVVGLCLAAMLQSILNGAKRRDSLPEKVRIHNQVMDMLVEDE